MATFRPNFAYSGDPRSAPYAQGLANLTAAMLGSAQDDAAIAQAGYTRSREAEQRMKNDRLRQQYAAQDSLSGLLGGVDPAAGYEASVPTILNAYGTMAPFQSPDNIADFMGAFGGAVASGTQDTDGWRAAGVARGLGNVEGLTTYDDQRTAEREDLSFSENAATSRAIATQQMRLEQQRELALSDPTRVAQGAVLGAQTPAELSALDAGVLALVDPSFTPLAQSAIVDSGGLANAPEWAIALGDVDTEAVAARSIFDQTGQYPIPNTNVEGMLRSQIAQEEGPRAALDAGRTRTEVREGDPSPVDEAFQTFDANRVTTILESGTAAREALPRLESMLELAQTPGIYQGPGGNAVLQIQRLADVIGLDLGNVEDAQLMNSFVQQGVLAELQATNGVATNEDARRMEMAQANMGNTAEGNVRVLQEAIAIQQERAMRAQVLQEMYQQGQPVDQLSFEAELRRRGLLGENGRLTGFSVERTQGGGGAPGDSDMSGLSDEEILQRLGVSGGQ